MSMAGPATTAKAADAAAAMRRYVADDPAEAADRLKRLLVDDPRSADGYRLLGDALRRLGRNGEAAEAEMEAVRATAFDPLMIEIARAMAANDLPRAEAGLRARLREQPLDVAAIRMMAELAGR